MWQGEYTWILWELWGIASCLGPWKSIAGCVLDALGPALCDSMRFSSSYMLWEVQSDAVLCSLRACLSADWKKQLWWPHTDGSHSPCCTSASSHTACPTAGLSRWVVAGHSSHFLSKIWGFHQVCLLLLGKELPLLPPCGIGRVVLSLGQLEPCPSQETTE